MSKVRVGELYNPRRTRWPEGSLLRMGVEGVELLLMLQDPTNLEIMAARKGRPEFAWVDGGPVGILCHRFGTDLPWSDSPYEASKETLPSPGPALVPQGRELLVLVVLLDADTGIVKAVRPLSWPRPFVQAVRENVDRQLTEPSSDQEVSRALARLHRYTAQDLAEKHAAARCGNGT